MHTSTKIAARCVWYTPDTHGVKALQSYTAIQRYTALYSIQPYIAIHYTPSTTPLWWNSVYVARVGGTERGGSRKRNTVSKGVAIYGSSARAPAVPPPPVTAPEYGASVALLWVVTYRPQYLIKVEAVLVGSNSPL